MSAPQWFQAACQQAAKGGSNTYETAGYRFANALRNLVPEDIDVDDWQERVDINLVDFSSMFDTTTVVIPEPPTEQQAIDWLKENAPECIKLVPAKRRGTFLKGVCRYAKDVMHGSSSLTRTERFLQARAKIEAMTMATTNVDPFLELLEAWEPIDATNINRGGDPANV
jgi:hypothetical protein